MFSVRPFSILTRCSNVKYCMAGDLLVTEKGEGRRIWYYYDSAANPVSMRVSGKDYFYVRNLQNDVIALIDDTGETVVEYKYNSWGKILSITGSKAGTIGKTNPFRYRGYYYDEETGMYYLKNRYYDPEIRRFISADSYISGFNSTMCNVFCYCGNNPVSNTDPEGTFFKQIVHFFKSKWKKTKKAVSKVYSDIKNAASKYTDHYSTVKAEGKPYVVGPAKVRYSESIRNVQPNPKPISIYTNSINVSNLEKGISFNPGSIQSGISITKDSINVNRSISVGKKYSFGGSVYINDKHNVGVTGNYTVLSGDKEITAEIDIEISGIFILVAAACFWAPELIAIMPAAIRI